MYTFYLKIGSKEKNLFLIESILKQNENYKGHFSFPH